LILRPGWGSLAKPSFHAHKMANAPSDGSHNAVPPCPTCKRVDAVEPLPLTDLSPGVQYYRCGHCGFTWATREESDGEFLSA
jgi:transposase-like protein